MESASWKVLMEWSQSNIVTYSVYAMCAPSSQELLVHQSFILCLLALLLLFAWASRHEPVTSNEGANLLTAVSLICPVLITSVILSQYFTDSAMDDVSRTYSSNRDLISAASMILVAYICLTTVFMPIMYTIHKYGQCPFAAALCSILNADLCLPTLPSETDASLGTASAFTMFQRSSGGVNAIGLTAHQHLSASDQRLLDNLSTSSTSTNADSFLGMGGVNSNPNSRLLMSGAAGKGGRKKESSRKSGSAAAAGKHSSPPLSSKSGHHLHQPIFSPQTASYHCESSPLLSCAVLCVTDAATKCTSTHPDAGLGISRRRREPR